MIKLFLLLCIMCFSYTSYATCPDLSGSFYCYDSENLEQSWQQENSQTIKDSALVYHFGDIEVVVDGQKRPFQVGNISGTYHAICNEIGQLRYYVNGDVLAENNEVIGQIDRVIAIYNISKNMNQSIIQDFVTTEEGAKPSGRNIVCQRAQSSLRQNAIVMN